MEQISARRLLTRGDLDGLICAVLIKYLDIVETVELIDHPSRMQAREVEVNEQDITTNLPYVPGVRLAIDHHFSETLRNKPDDPRHIIDPEAPSAARVVYDYFGGSKRFPAFFDDMMEAVDKADAGRFTREEILHPEGWPLLNFLVDQRTGIEQWGSFRVSEEQFKLALIDHLLGMRIDEILEIADVKERANVYFRYENDYKEQLKEHATTVSSVVVLDFRDTEEIYPGNRFIVYALYPDCNISVLIRRDTEDMDGGEGQVTFSVGKSIVNTTARVNIGELMLRYGGGGHRAAGACHVSADKAEQVYRELIEVLTGSGQR
jgi:nanoRNase/pAp phosphatase (c-di-AMP/oligoRNAs hydrolase)